MPQLSEDVIKKLEEKAKLVRRHIVTMIAQAQVGHPGGSLSAADILTALFFHVLRIDPQNPEWEDRDRFVLSKGHAASALYATLAERGYFPVDRLSAFGRIDSALQVHPDKNKVPGVEASTGALGQGLSIALGMALGGRLDGKDFRVYALLGDGEIQEGQIWEAAMCAAHYKVDSLTAILDYNGIQLMGPIPTIMEIAPVRDKWCSFGWKVLEIDGHNMKEIVKALESAREVKGRPTMVVAHTIKGKGVSFMEATHEWHGRPLTQEELSQALAELA
jgi:transketolase